MAQKILFTKPTYNALTETDPNNMVFSSDYDTLKYYSLGSKSLNIDWANYYHSRPGGFMELSTIYYHKYETTITHDLGYRPFFTVYLLDTLGGGETTQLPFVYGDAYSFVTIMCYVDTTKLYIVYYAGLENTSSGTTTIDFKYRIYRNDLGL